MINKSIKRAGLTLVPVAIIGMLAPRSSMAIFGVNIDPIQSGHAITQIGQTARQIGQMETIIGEARQNLDIIKQNVLALGHKDTYAHLVGAMTSAGMDAATYRNAKLPLDSNAAVQSTREALATYGHVTLSDAASEGTVATINQIQSEQNTDRAAIHQWSGKVNSADPNDNTAAALAGLTNVGLLNIYDQQRQILSVNTAMAQSLAVQNLKERNDEVAVINADAQRQRISDSVGVGDLTLSNYRDR